MYLLFSFLCLTFFVNNVSYTYIVLNEWKACSENGIMNLYAISKLSDTRSKKKKIRSIFSVQSYSKIYSSNFKVYSNVMSKIKINPRAANIFHKDEKRNDENICVAK